MRILSYLFGVRAKNRPGVYTITNRHTGRVYIGATAKTIAERWQRHRYMLDTGRHHNKHLQADWNRYGAHSFKFAILEVVNDGEQAFEREREWQRRRYTPEGLYNPDPDATLSGSGGLLRRRGPEYERSELLALYREMRVQGYTRDKARAVLRERGINLDNNLWSQAGRPLDPT